jgi:hypothetical protein
MYSKPRRSNAWESEEAKVVRFWTDDGDSWGFLFHYLTAIHYSARLERLLITWTLGTLLSPVRKSSSSTTIPAITGQPHLTDGKDILAVTIVLNAESNVDALWPNL